MGRGFFSALLSRGAFTDGLVLDVLQTQDERRFQAFVEHEMARADLDMDGLLNRDEFYMYYYSKLCFDLPPNIELPDVRPGVLFLSAPCCLASSDFSWYLTVLSAD